jgi:hypothetical protein
MRGSAFCVAGAVVFLVPPYSCHKPTAQEEYAQAKHCYAAYGASLKIVPAARFTQAGINPALIERASDANVDGAYDAGKQIGMSPGAISRDLEQAKAAYLRAHAGSGDADQKFNDLREDVNGCIGDDYGRPND